MATTLIAVGAVLSTAPPSLAAWQGIGEVGASVLDRCGTMAGQWDSSPEGHPPGIAAKADPAQILNP